MKPFLLLPLALALIGQARAAEAKPNIIVILTDDQGWADLGCQGAVKDVRTPHLDALAAGGVRCTAGYITAPQCSPSRAGLITGRYQQRFGLDTIPDTPLPLEEVTLAERLRPAGYVCGMVGKWHLDPNHTSSKWIQRNLPRAPGGPSAQVRIPDEARRKFSAAGQGFDEFFQGQIRGYWANFGLDGRSLAREGKWVNCTGYRLEVQTDAALAFIERNHTKPFYLHLAYFAPHTPLVVPTNCLARFAGPMPERRRYALAMISAIDDGVGRIMARLRKHGLEEKTLVVFTSDNGAPIHNRRDSPIDTDMGGWDGSVNDPHVGEKGMLSEGGIRVPFLWSWKGTLPAGKTFDYPVISLDIAATAVVAAGLPRGVRLDGVNLLPFFTGAAKGAPHDALFWRFWDQSAVRAGQWKLIHLGDGAEFLFDLASPDGERKNVLAAHPDTAKSLRDRLAKWCGELQPPGLPANGITRERRWYEQYFGHTNRPSVSERPAR